DQKPPAVVQRLDGPEMTSSEESATSAILLTGQVYVHRLDPGQAATDAYLQAFILEADNALDETLAPAPTVASPTAVPVIPGPTPVLPLLDDAGIPLLNRGSAIVQPDQRPYYVINGQVNLLDLPDAEADVFLKLEQGDIVTLINGGQEWSKVMLQSGQIGYLMTSQITTEVVLKPTPSPSPSPSPSPKPTRAPTPSPKPTQKPTAAPTAKPTQKPTAAPTATPTAAPTAVPTSIPEPVITPTAAPTLAPTLTPKPTPTTTPFPTGSGLTEEQQQTMIDLARSLIGTRYVYAAMSPTVGFDCSGFTSYIYKTLFDIKLPRTARDQSKFGTPVSSADIRVGDILCFDWFNNDGICDHVGLYIGNGKYIHASSSDRTYYTDSGAVKESTVIFGKSPVISIRRIIP
ncbi:MAG: C40 family peptidase, partial [Bacillota bacterium]|nr:C40 family peptidase [Bacillota bacterium]